MTKLIFIRHAETDMAGTFCGHSDPELNAHGISQLPNLVEQLKCWPIQEIYSSDLRRAKQTAQPIAAHFQLECKARKELREIYFGRWEGLRWSEIEMTEPEEASCWIEEYPKRNFPEGEATNDFLERVVNEVEFYLEKRRGRTIAIVTHAGFIQVALTRIFGMSEEKSWNLTREYASFVLVDSPPVMKQKWVEDCAGFSVRFSCEAQYEQRERSEDEYRNETRR